jgi:hypothetical protein
VCQAPEKAVNPEMNANEKSRTKFMSYSPERHETSLGKRKSCFEHMGLIPKM